MSTATIETVDLEKVEVNLLPELKGWKEKQLQIVKENPFIEISDNASYDEAKKNRTALVSARTGIQNQEKLIASKLKSIRDKVKDASADLISITQPHEEKQQAEVKRFEAIKEKQRIEKERIEQERKDGIVKEIRSQYEHWKNRISILKFSELELFQSEFNSSIEDQNVEAFEEFEMQYAENINLLKSQLQERSQYLTEQENTRLEREKLAKEKEDFEKQQAEAKAVADKEAAERKAQEEEDQKKRDAEQKLIDDKRKADQAALDAQRKELEDEKARLAQIEKEKQEAIDAERKAQEAKKLADEKAKREDALKPDVEKLKTVIKSIGIHSERPELNDPNAQLFFTKITGRIEELKSELSIQLSRLQ